MKCSKLELLQYIVCWSLGVFFFVLYFLYVGFPPKYPADALDFIYLGLALLLALFPFVRKIQIGDFFQLEKEIEKTKREIEEQRQFTSTMFSALSTNISTIANMQNIVNIYNVMGASRDPIDPTTMVEMKLNADSLSSADLAYLHNRMVHSFVDEKTRENIDVSSLDWAYYSDDLFWLGQNLTYIKAILISRGPKSMIEHTLGQAYAHMKNLGLKESLSIRQIAGLRIELSKLSEAELDIILREKYARIIQECIYRIGGLSSEFQRIHLMEEDHS